MVRIANENQITLGYEKITGEYVFRNGRESLLILALLSRRYSIRGVLIFSFNDLFKKLKIPLNKKDKKDNVIKCINNMFTTNFDNKTNINEIYDLPYEILSNQYLIITDDEVDRILNCDSKIDKYNLFNTYIAIKRYVNFENGKSYPSIETILYVTNIGSNNTVLKCIKTLEEIKMIKCTRSYDFVKVNGELRRPNNEYEITLN